MRVWFVSELFWPEETSTGYFLTRIAEEVGTEYEVHAVCSQPTYSARGVRAQSNEVRNGVHIARVASTTLNKDVLLFRALNMVTFSISAFVHVLLRVRRGDILVAVTNPPAIPYLIRVAASLRGTRFVLLVHDVYPEVFVATGLAAPDAVHVRALHRMSAWLYRSADRVVVLGRDMQRLVGAKLGNADAPAVIPNWGDTELITPDPAAGAAVRHRLGLDDRFVIQYMGNMGRTHDVASLIEAATLLRSDERFHFLFIGWGARRAWLEQQVAGRALTNVTVLDPCDQADMPGYLNAADVAVISFLAGMAGVSVPSRLYNVMASGTPVLAVTEENSEIAQVVREEQIGWVVAPESPERLVELVRSIAANEEGLHAAGQRARAAAQRSYSRAVVGRRWKDLLCAMESAPPERV